MLFMKRQPLCSVSIVEENLTGFNEKTSFTNERQILNDLTELQNLQITEYRIT